MSDDSISRQAAIYIASGYCHPANIAKELAKLPSAQPRWISVTEAMPDEHNRVLILTDDGTIFIGDHNEYWEDDYEFEIDDVIAWMPLPEPARLEEE